MFQTDDAWEVQNSNYLGSDVRESNARKYRLMELPLNLPLFHVDVGQYIDADFVWSRYIVMDFAHVKQFLELNGDFIVRLSLQTRRTDIQDYSVVRIREILESTDCAGNVGYIYVDMNGRRHPDFRWHGDVNFESHSSTIWTDRNADFLR